MPVPDENRYRAFLASPAPARFLARAVSTNDEAKAWARQGAPHGAAVLAAEQSGGRGRRGRGFFSPPGGLYLSVVLHPGAASPGLLTTLAAVAALRAVRLAGGPELAIKWVNDLLYQGKKVGGILTEGVCAPDGGARAVVGIGLNLGPAAFPPELEGQAGTLFGAWPDAEREKTAALIVNEILEGLPRVPEHLAEYRARCATLGRRVAFQSEGREAQGRAEGVDGEGRLLVNDGRRLLTLMEGEASLLPE